MSTALLQPPAFWNRFGDLSKFEGFRASQDWSTATSPLKDYIEGTLALIPDVHWQWHAQGILVTKTAQSGFERKRPLKIYGLLPTASGLKMQEASPSFSRQSVQWIQEASAGVLNLSGASEGRLHLALVLALLESSSVVQGPLAIQLSITDPYPIEVEDEPTWVIHLKAVTEGVLFVGSPGGVDAHMRHPISRLPTQRRVCYQLTWKPEFSLANDDVPYLEASYLGRMLGKVLDGTGLYIEHLSFSDGLQGNEVQVKGLGYGKAVKVDPEASVNHQEALATGLEPSKVLGRLVSLNGPIAMASLRKARLELSGICTLERSDEAESSPLTDDSQNQLLRGLRVVPSARCSGYRPADRPGSIRLGELQLAEHEASWTLRVRSFQPDWVMQIEDQLQALFQLMGAPVVQSCHLNGWSPVVASSEWVQYMLRTYKCLFDRSPDISPLPVSMQALHFEALGTADNHIVMGPSLLYDPAHSAAQVDVKSMRKCWDYLVMALKGLPEYSRVVPHYE